MLNPNALKWVEALESGDYQQCKGRLGMIDEESQTSYCCLGVACEVARVNGVELKVETLLRDRTYNGCLDILPAVVKDWLGLSSKSGFFESHSVLTIHKGTSLTSLNDNGVSFKRIAEIIRSEPAELFKQEE